MSEYWKSTPSYWCKFCETYVRDTPVERKNHESTGKHQGNIQRSLRELHKKQEREKRDQQRAKDEVARLNGLVSGKSGFAVPATGFGAANSRPSAPAASLSAAAQRKAHAEQLVALGVTLPEELKREVTGVSGWQTLSETIVRPTSAAGRTLADIKREEEAQGEARHSLTASEGLSVGVRKRKAEDEPEVARDEEAAPRMSKVWGSTLKKYPGNAVDNDVEDLNELLGGVSKNTVTTATSSAVPATATVQSSEPMLRDGAEKVGTAAFVAQDEVKIEANESAVTAAPVVVFKKRKAPKR